MRGALDTPQGVRAVGMPLRVLIVEDSEDDCALVVRELRRGGYELTVERVETPEAMSAALERQRWDLVIADHALPRFSGPAALALLQKHGLDLPFIIVSGSIGEETAVATMRAGAHDYILKDNLGRLAAAVPRELRDAEGRRRRRRAEASLRILAEAGEALASSLDYETTLAQLARLLVPKIADWCAVHMKENGGEARLLAVVHAGGREDLVHELLRRYPAPQDRPHGYPQVLRTGQSELIPEITDDILQKVARDADHLRLMRALGLRSQMSLPLRARGHTLGAVTLVSAESRRRFDAEDLETAEQIMRRASMAIDNALLFREAQEAVRVRDEFLSIASHELKTPLTPLQLHVQGLLHLVKGEPTGALTEKLESRLIVADRQVTRLAKLVDNLLDISRISAGRIDLDLEAVELVSLARNVTVRFQQEMTQAGCTLGFHAAGPVIGRWDPIRVEQIVTNLLSNAVKYGAGKPIDVTVEGDDRVGRIVVRDHGIGIAPESQARIFERFERAVSERHYGGFGLGLWIVRKIVDAFGGTIRVESAPGRGATFTVELPRVPLVRS
ncbi:MAG: hybrid sensor histidine kinase/response regulator [Myxococcota bacterium]